MLITAAAKRTSSSVNWEYAEPPRLTVDTTFPTVTGTTHTVTSAAEFTTALANAVGGDEIVLTVNVTGTFNLPNRGENGWVLIRSDNASWQSTSTTRVTNGTNMRKVTGAGSPVRAITCSNGAHHYRFVGIEFACPTTPYCTSLIAMGAGVSSSANLPHHLTFDRCYIHGDPTIGGARGISMDGNYIAVIHSRVDDFKAVGSDTQALYASNGEGPFLVWNCYLEGAAETMMFGGADPSITNLVPSDITIRGNHFFKRTAWQSESWDIKNIFEIKNARRVLIEQNLFENIWNDVQAGFCFNLKAVNQGDGGGSAWSECSDVTIRYNKLKNCGNGWVITGISDQPASTLTRMLIQHNVAEITRPTGTEIGDLFMILNGPQNVYILHNTVLHIGSTGASANTIELDGTPVDGTVTFKDNIVSRGSSGIKGSGQSEGTGSLDYFLGTYTMLDNLFIGANSANYPADNSYPANTTAVGFVDYAGADYALDAGSAYKNAASDGTDPGANVALVEAYAAAAEAG